MNLGKGFSLPKNNGERGTEPESSAGSTLRIRGNGSLNPDVGPGQGTIFPH